MRGILIAAGIWVGLIVLICTWFRFAAYHDDDPWPYPDSEGEPLPADWAYTDTADDQ